VLPAWALGQCDVTFGAAWRGGRPNTLRLFTTYVLCIAPWLLISAAIAGGLDAGLSLFMEHEYAFTVAGVPCDAAGWLDERHRCGFDRVSRSHRGPNRAALMG
jgi:hypothetical protein